MREPNFRTIPISEVRPISRRGRWPAIIAAARKAAKQGEALEFDGDERALHNARANLYSGRHVKPGESIHISYKDGVIQIWMTFADEPDGSA